MSERRDRAALRRPTNTPAPLRWLLSSVGGICVGLGVLGIFVPLLPTTPFLLVAAACFVRSSDRLYQRLITHRTLGPYIRNYREHRAITRRARIVTLVLLWGTISYAVLWPVDTLALRVVLLGIATAVTVHLVRLTTVADNTPSDRSNDAVQS
jgi:uncharacterized membrane protein YbaN (DUF454 family)